MKLSMKLGVLASALFVLCLVSGPVAAQQEVKLAEGKLTLTAPESWEAKQPTVRIIEAELLVPAEKAKTDPGRLTIMSAGGGIEANIDRWYGQFTQPDGSATSKASKREKFDVSGMTVHLVDIPGTFKDQRGPFAPAKILKDYRMLGVIIETKDVGTYFVKLAGPSKTLEENKEAFVAFIKSAKASE